MKTIYYLLVALFISTTATAQETQDSVTKQSKPDSSKVKYHSISIGSDGVAINEEHKTEKVFSIKYMTLDLGFNTLLDNTNYRSPAAQQFMQVDSIPMVDGKEQFSLRSGKSINVNLWPVIAKVRVLGTDKQKIYISTGVGMQIYNFRYSKNITYQSEPTNRVITDTVNFTKNKLAVNYLSIPLGFTFKTKLAEKAWLVYGFGVTGGYRIDSWIKQKSAERGKEKNHDKFNLGNFNSCITGEFGINGIFRLYASYQITPLHETALEQYPLSIGFRIGGV